MKIGLAGITVLAAAVVLSGSLVGCTKTERGLSSSQVQTANRLDAITKQSGGDWSKVSSADRDYILKNVTHGNEQAARMLLLAKSGKLHGAPGTPPKK